MQAAVGVTGCLPSPCLRLMSLIRGTYINLTAPPCCALSPRNRLWVSSSLRARRRCHCCSSCTGAKRSESATASSVAPRSAVVNKLSYSQSRAHNHGRSEASLPGTRASAITFLYKGVASASRRILCPASPSESRRSCKTLRCYRLQCGVMRCFASGVCRWSGARGHRLGRSPPTSPRRLYETRCSSGFSHPRVPAGRLTHRLMRTRCVGGRRPRNTRGTQATSRRTRAQQTRSSARFARSCQCWHRSRCPLPMLLVLALTSFWRVADDR
mmetsp:Transcript_31389/g.73041  ORF Transcript_31389/g.73041 Transcript_31389/m.73041 type:complete len:270 (-) Transcript_31389:186-995(-)